MMVELTTSEATLFRLLAEADAWSIRKGSFTVHVDAHGVPSAVETRRWTQAEVMHRQEVDNDLQVSF